MSSMFQEAMVELWKQLREQYEENANKLGAVNGDRFLRWCNKLNYLDDKYLVRCFAAALIACSKRESEWPPNLNTFMKFCITEQDRLIAWDRRLIRPVPARLGNFKARQEVAQKNLKELKEIINAIPG